MIAAGVIGALIAVFAIVNLDQVKVHWLVTTGKTPLILVIGVAFLLGIVVDRLAIRARRKRAAVGHLDSTNRAVIADQAVRVRSRRATPASPSLSNPRCSSRTAVSSPRAVKVTSTSVASLGSKNRCHR